MTPELQHWIVIAIKALLIYLSIPVAMFLLLIVSMILIKIFYW